MTLLLLGVVVGMVLGFGMAKCEVVGGPNDQASA